MAYKVMLDHKTTEFKLFEHLDEARKFLMDMFDEPGHGVWEKETDLRDLKAGKIPYDYIAGVFMEDADVLEDRYRTAGVIGHVYPKNKSRLNMLSDYYWIPIDLSESKEQIMAKAKNIPLKDDGSLFDYCGPKDRAFPATRPDLAECFVMDSMEAPDGIPFKNIETARGYLCWAMKPKDCPVKTLARIKLKDGTTDGAALKYDKRTIVYGHGDEWRKVLDNGNLGARVRYKGPDIEWLDNECKECKKELIFRK